MFCDRTPNAVTDLNYCPKEVQNTLYDADSDIIRNIRINTYFLLCVGECPMYICANFEDATIYNKKVTREEVDLFDQPLYALCKERKSLLPKSIKSKIYYSQCIIELNVTFQIFNLFLFDSLSKLYEHLHVKC